MASVNKVILIGNLGRDPEVRYAQSGTAICSVTLATSRQWKDKTTGERQEETEWHRVTLFDRLAEVAAEFLKMGRPVYIEGRLKTRKYTDKDGVEKYATDIIATEMQLLASRDGGESATAQPPHKAQTSRTGPAAPTSTSRQKQPSSPADEEYDPPF